jgi:hypothetical protein
MNALTSMHDDDAQFQVPEKFIDLLVEWARLQVIKFIFNYWNLGKKFKSPSVIQIHIMSLKQNL